MPILNFLLVIFDTKLRILLMQINHKKKINELLSLV
jgi:hypothetical protein